MRCSMSGCTNATHINKNVNFFKFPSRLGIKNIWTNICKKTEIGDNAVICSLHFKESDIIQKAGKTCLVMNAMPINFDALQNSKSPDLLQVIYNRDIKIRALEIQKSQIEKNLEELRKSLKFLSESQIDILQYPTQTPRYTTDDFSKSISLYTSGPKCYTNLRKFGFPIPAPSTLKNWLRQLSVEPGIQYEVLNLMKRSEIPKEEQIVVLSFDEIKIREEWAYDQRNDEIIRPKSWVQVAMVRSLRGHWKQPIYYGFDEVMSEELLKMIITKLHEIGLTVVAMVCDLGTSNQHLWTRMGVPIDEQYFENPADSTKLIFCISGVPHLLKLLKSHFVDDGFIFENKKLTKDIIVELLNMSDKDLNIAPKFNIDMLNVKSSGRQLFSNTMSVALTRSTQLGLCSNTELFIKCAQFIKIINDWFDIFNTNCFNDTRPLKRSYGLSLPEQDEVLKNVKSTIPLLYGKEKLKPFQKAIINNCNALPMLLTYLKNNYNMQNLPTRKLKQDVIEIVFSSVGAKGRLPDHPSPLEFKYRLGALLFGRNDTTISSNSSTEDASEKSLEIFPDSKEDSDEILTERILSKLNSELQSNEDEGCDYEMLEEDEIEITDNEMDGLENFGGNLICKLKLDETYGIRTCETENDKLTKQFKQQLINLNSIFLNVVGDNFSVPKSLLKTLMDSSQSISMEDKIKKRFFRGRIFFKIRLLNR